MSWWPSREEVQKKVQGHRPNDALVKAPDCLELSQCKYERIGSRRRVDSLVVFLETKLCEEQGGSEAVGTAATRAAGPVPNALLCRDYPTHLIADGYRVSKLRLDRARRWPTLDTNLKLGHRLPCTQATLKTQQSDQDEKHRSRHRPHSERLLPLSEGK